jgi:hypothetical protein
VILIETAAMRVQISQLERDCRDIMQKMGRQGVNQELLTEYERLDTQILHLRMKLVEDLRTVLRDRSTSLYD